MDTLDFQSTSARLISLNKYLIIRLYKIHSCFSESSMDFLIFDKNIHLEFHKDHRTEFTLQSFRRNERKQLIRKYKQRG